MLPLKVFLQFAAVASSFGGCYALSSYTVKSIMNKNVFEYYLVDGSVPRDNKEEGNLFTGKNKNYKCEISAWYYDYDCELFKLSEEEQSDKASNKSVNLASLLNRDSLVKGEIKNQTYILKIAKKYIYSNTFETPILLKSLKSPKKSFVSLTINKHLKTSNKAIKSRFAVVKFVVGDQTDGFDSSREHFCDFGKNKNVKCKLKELGKIVDYYFFESSISETSIGQNLNKYYLLEFVDETQAKTSAELKGEKIIFFENKDKTKISSFQFEELIIKELFNHSAYFSINESKKWLVTSADASASSAQDELITAATWDKNYKCKLIPSDKEVDCDLYSLNYANDRASSSFTNTKYWEKELKTKSELTADTFFKLKVNAEQLPSLKLDGTETIEVIHKTSKEAYATLTPKFELQDHQISGNTNLVIGKFSEKITDSTETTTAFKCKFDEKEEAKECDIYKFTGTAADASSVNFSTLQKLINSNNIETTKFFVIDLKDQKISSTIAKTDKKTVEITVQADPNKTAKFTVETPLIGLINSTASKNKIIFPK